MPASPWQRRIRRAQDLATQHPFAAEILGFYIHVVRYQEDLHRRMSAALQSQAASADRELTASDLLELSSAFESFLSMAEAHGPKSLAELSRELHTRGRDAWSHLLQGGWIAHSPSNAEGLLAQAFLQPYAELLRSRAKLKAGSAAYGGARSMVCSFCLAEWEFRRIVCPGCGEEDDKNLAVFTASDFDYIRVECCETCKTYIKTIDLTKNGRAEPLVDELASVPLDLWAREHGYAKLQNNLLGM